MLVLEVVSETERLLLDVKEKLADLELEYVEEIDDEGETVGVNDIVNEVVELGEWLSDLLRDAEEDTDFDTVREAVTVEDALPLPEGDKVWVKLFDIVHE